MSHKLYDITLYYYFHPQDELAKAFTKRQNLVAGLYVSLLNNYKPQGTTRISVELGDQDRIGAYMGSILSVTAEFDPVEYWKKSIRDQQLMIVDTIHRVAMLCAERYTWDKEIFSKAYQNAIESNFTHAVEFPSKLARDRKHRAAILLKKNEEYAAISVRFYTPDGTFIRVVELLKVRPHEMFYGNLIKANKWLSNTSFGLCWKQSEVLIQASIDQEQPTVIINPKTHSQHDLEGLLAQVAYPELSAVARLLPSDHYA